MTEARAFPADWLPPSLEGPASDLDLVVLLLNSLDLLANPADRLVDLGWYRAALRQAGHGALADELAEDCLPDLRRLREDLRTVFESQDPAVAADLLNERLRRADAVPLLVPGDAGLRLAVAPDRTGYAALAARLPAALAAFVAQHGLARLGVCGSDPCRCAFLDRTRAGTRRYCCGWCNDRHAARAYRRRRAQDRAGDPTSAGSGHAGP